MIDRIRSYAAYGVFILGLVVVALAGVPILLLSAWQARSWLVSRFGRLLGKAVLAVAGVRIRVVDHRNGFEGPAVYILNHASTIDMFVILALGMRRVRFVAKTEFQYNPVIFLLGHLTGHIFLDRARGEKALQHLNRRLDRIRRAGDSLVMAPEGSRTHAGRIGPFKRGAFQAALRLRYPMVPIHIEGADDLSQGDTIVTAAGTVTVHLHAPIPTTDWTEENLTEQVAAVRNRYLIWAGVNPTSDTPG